MWIFTCMQELFQCTLRSLKIKDKKAVLIITDICGQQWDFSAILNIVTRAYLLHMQKRLEDWRREMKASQMPWTASQMSSFQSERSYQCGWQSPGMIGKSCDTFPPNTFQTLEFCGSDRYWNGITRPSFFKWSTFFMVFLQLDGRFSWLMFSFSS